MALRITRATQQHLLEYLTADLTIHLFTNNAAVSDTTTLTDLTEATFTGYSSVALDAGEWNITQGATTVAEHSQMVPFVSSASGQNQQVHGYYVTDTSSGALRWAENFETLPDPIANDGDTIRVRPRIDIQARQV